MQSRLSLLAAAAALCFATPAMAQLNLGGIVGGVTDTLGGVTDAVGGVTDTVTDGLGEATDTSSTAEGGDTDASTGAVRGNTSRVSRERFLAPTRNTAKIYTLLKLIDDRRWARFADGDALCLPNTRTAGVEGYLNKRELQVLPAQLKRRASVIADLRGHLKRCSGNGSVDAATRERVIGVSVLENGQAVLIVL